MEVFEKNIAQTGTCIFLKESTISIFLCLERRKSRRYLYGILLLVVLFFTEICNIHITRNNNLDCIALCKRNKMIFLSFFKLLNSKTNLCKKNNIHRKNILL